MNNVKKYIIILSIIMISAVLIKNFADFSSVPELNEFEKEPTVLSIINSNGKFVFKKNKNQWLLNEEFQADKQLVNKIVNDLSKCNIESLISEKEYYSQYGLQKGAAAEVVLMNGKEVLRKIFIGKKAGSKKSVFARFENDLKGVYIVSGIESSDYTYAINKYRDKQMLTIDPKAVSEFSVKAKQNEFILLPEKDDKGGIKWEEKFIGKELDQKKVNTFLSAVLNLNAVSFTDKPNSEYAAYFEVKAFSKIIKIELYDKNSDDEYICKTSELPYYFTVPAFQAENMIKSLNDLLP